eukprot:Hpha_TRINITY_DN16480_c7_g2::TRINITY_DN16480_c7_g2_i1::g.163768::m.163768
MPFQTGRGNDHCSTRHRSPPRASAFSGVSRHDDTEEGLQLERELRRELETKDRRMRQLQEQVAGLLRYKGECHHYQSECIILTERLQMLQERSARGDLDAQGVEAGGGRQRELERENELLKMHAKDRVQSLEAHVQALRDDSERQTAAQELMQGELLSLQRSAQQQRMSYEAREVKWAQQQKRYEEQIATQRAQLHERESNAVRVTTHLQEVRQELRSREALLEEAVAAEEITGRREMELRGKMTQVSQQLAAEEERVRVLSRDLEALPVLRRELAESARERQELGVVKQQLQLLEAQHRDERQRAQRLDDDLRRAVARGEEADRLLASERAAALDADALEDRCTVLRLEGAAVQEALAAEQRKTEQLSRELETVRKEGRESDAKATAAFGDLQQLLRSASAVAAAVFEHQPTSLPNLSEPDPRADVLPPAIRREAVDLCQTLAVLSGECARLRVQSESCRERVGTQQTLAQQLTRERDELLREKESLQQRLEDSRESARAAEEAARKSESELGVWRGKAEGLQKQLRVRSEALMTALQQCVPRSPRHVEEVERTVGLELPPVLKLGVAAADEQALSFDTLLWKLQDHMTSQQQYAQRMRTRAEGLQLRVEEAEGMALEAQRSAVHTSEALRAELQQQQGLHHHELRALKDKHTTHHSTTTESLRELERDAAALRAEKKEAERGLARAEAEGEQLQQQCRRAVAEVEQFRRRWEAAEERRVAAEKDNETEHQRANRAEAAVRELTQQLTSVEELSAVRDTQVETAAEERRRVEAEVCAARSAADATAQRLEEAECAARAAEARAERCAHEKATLGDELKEAQRLRAVVEAHNLEEARQLACIRALARAVAPLREQSRELKWQRRVVLQWARELEQALQIVMSDTRTALVEAGVGIPPAKEKRPPFRTVAIAALAAGRLARLAKAPGGARLMTVRGGELLPLLPQQAALSLPAGHLPYPPPGSKSVSDEGRTGWRTSMRDDAEGVLNVVEAVVWGSHRSRGEERGHLVRRLTGGLRRSRRRLPVEEARSFTREVGLRVRGLRIDALDTRRELDDRAEEGGLAEQRIWRLSEDLRSKDSRIASLETHVEQLHAARQASVPAERATELECALEAQRAELAAVRMEQRHHEEEVEGLRRELREERRLKEELASQNKQWAEAHAQTTRALELKKSESEQLTDFLQCKARETVSAARQLTGEAVEAREALARRTQENQRLGTALKKRKQELRSLEGALRADLADSRTPSLRSGRRERQQREKTTRHRSPGRFEVRVGERVRVDVVSAETGRTTGRTGTVVCGPSGVPVSVYVRLDGDAGAAKFRLEDIQPADLPSPSHDPGLSDVMYESGMSSTAEVGGDARAGGLVVGGYLAELNRQVDKALGVSRPKEYELPLRPVR